MQGLFASGRRGAHLVDGGVAFSLWAPRPERVDLQIVSGARAGMHVMRPNGDGLWGVMLEQVVPGDRYAFVIEGHPLPDPCSRFQPEGALGPSQVVDPASFVTAAPRFAPAAQSDLVLYELHVGAFTPEGTLAAASWQLPALRELGFNGLLLMPVAQFGGEQSWGYEAVSPYAVAASYGGPDALAQFVETAHALGMAVFLDGTYDRLGLESSYLAEFGPYFARDLRDDTPSSLDLNLEGPGAAPVREYALRAALGWISDHGVDGLKLTSHRGADVGPMHLWRELAERVAALSSELGRDVRLIGEAGRNEVRLIQPRNQGGFGLDALWAEDFHHALHALLTPARDGKLIDFGSVDHLKRAAAQGFAFEGEWSRYRGGPHGTFARREPTERFVVFSESHEVGHGVTSAGQRLGTWAGAQAERLALTLTLFFPGVPLIFMGQEYGESAPFLPFDGPGADPYALQRSRLDLSQREAEGHRGLLRLTQDLIGLRAKHEQLRDSHRPRTVVEIDQRRRLLCVRRGVPGQRLMLLASFAKTTQNWEGYLPEARWEPLLDCADTRYEGSGKSTDVLTGGFSSVPPSALAGRVFREGG